MIKTINVSVLDEIHLELSQPILAQQGTHIKILIADDKEEDYLWQEASQRHFLKAYDEEDSIYDKL